MKTVRSPAAIDRATPARLWVWAAFIALVGIAARVIWFVQFEHQLPFGFDLSAAYSGHAWALEPSFRHAVGDLSINPYELTQAFAPGYGAMLRGLVEAAGGATASAHDVAVELLIVQSALVAFSTLLTFALARRVLFGWAALVPPVLITLSIALIELPGGLAPQIPLMFLIVFGVWLVTLMRERLPEGRGPAAVAITMLAGFTLGASILFNPAALLLVPLILWWAFRGLGSEHATLLLVAAVLIPATWLAVAQTQLTDGIPTTQAQTWIERDAGNVPNSLETVGNRVYAIATPWNARFARGPYASTNWNYEWIIPQSIRADTNYVAITRGLIAFFMVLMVVLAVLGLTELFAEGAGSAERLLALPVIALPFATFFSANGNLLRIPMLPFLAISMTLGWTWLIENLRPYIRERRSEPRAEWT